MPDVKRETASKRGFYREIRQTAMANALVTMLRALGIEMDWFADSSGSLQGLT
jgi:hypothetical protein